MNQRTTRLTRRRDAASLRFAGALAGALLLVAATPAQAYVGPGAGLSLLGALWGVAAALVAALGFVVIWPIRRMILRRAGRPGLASRDDPPRGRSERG